MPYTLSKSCISMKLVFDTCFELYSLGIDPFEYQLFITANIVVLWCDIYVYIYCKKSFYTQTGISGLDYENDLNYYLLDNSDAQRTKKTYAFAKNKLNYCRIYKDSRYQKYIRYITVIENIIEKYI